MNNENTLTPNPIELIPSVLDALKYNDKPTLNAIFDRLAAPEIAHLLESLPDVYRGQLWRFIPKDRNGDVLVELGDVARVSLANYLESDQVVKAVTGLDNNDLADIVDTLPDDIGDVIRQSLDYQGLHELEATLAFPEKSAGRLMETKLTAIRLDVKLESILRFLRKKEMLPEQTLS